MDTTQLPKMNEVKACKKCTHVFDELIPPSMNYHENVLLGLNGALINTGDFDVYEVLVRTCPECGFRWMEQTAENGVETYATQGKG